MKKIIATITMVILAMNLVACKTEKAGGSLHGYGYTESPTYYMMEWISPDGVHYWKLGASGGLTPRYDNNGNLVIDKE